MNYRCLSPVNVVDRYDDRLAANARSGVKKTYQHIHLWAKAVTTKTYSAPCHGILVSRFSDRLYHILTGQAQASKPNSWTMHLAVIDQQNYSR